MENETVKEEIQPIDAEFKISGGLWRESIGAISNLVEEAYLIIGEREITVKAMDPSQISMVEYTLPACGCEVFRVNNPGREYVFNFEDINQIAKDAGKDDRVNIRLNGHMEITYYTEYGIKIGLLNPRTTAAMRLKSLK